MFFKKFKKDLNNKLIENLNQSKELEWAHIYHDSIRGFNFLENLPLNVGRWAGNYSFFYVLNRILLECKPKNILDLGLGESSKMISTFLDNYLIDSKHTIVEQDLDWINNFKARFKLSNSSKIVHCPLVEKTINSFKSYGYANFSKHLNEKFDLYIVDGPFGSDRFSRFDILELLKNIDSSDEFIIIMDDYHRLGEKDTVNEIITLLSSKGFKFHTGTYLGNKSQFVLASEKYKFVTSL